MLLVTITSCRQKPASAIAPMIDKVKSMSWKARQ